ncbi:MAG TPA: FRG domain-containing protein [Acidobacteriota bacterium]
MPGWYDWQLFQNARWQQNTPVWARTFLFYRGQSNIRYSLMPSMLRGLKSKRKFASHRLMARESRQQQIVNWIFRTTAHIEEVLPDANSLDKAQRLAVARHYGAPSYMIDFTTDPEIAAFFATREVSNRQQMGVIYVLNLVELFSLSGSTGLMCHENVKSGWALPYGYQKFIFLSPREGGPPQWSTAFVYFNAGLQLSLKCITVPQCHRVEAQKAVFFEISTIGRHFAHDVYAMALGKTWIFMRFFLCHKLCFFQSAGAYSNLDRGICEATLIPSHDPIEKALKSLGYT